MAVAAPGPVFRVCDELIGDGIAVDVAKLLGEFLLREDVAVKVAALPELLARSFELL